MKKNRLKIYDYKDADLSACVEMGVSYEDARKKFISDMKPESQTTPHESSFDMGF